MLSQTFPSGCLQNHEILGNQSWSTALGSSLQSNGMRRGWEPGVGRAEAMRGNAAALSSRAVQSGCRSTRPRPHPQPQSTLLQSSLGTGITHVCSNAWGSAPDFCIPPTLPSVPLGSLPHAHPLLALLLTVQAPLLASLGPRTDHLCRDLVPW